MAYSWWCSLKLLMPYSKRGLPARPLGQVPESRELGLRPSMARMCSPRLLFYPRSWVQGLRFLRMVSFCRSSQLRTIRCP